MSVKNIRAIGSELMVTYDDNTTVMLYRTLGDFWIPAGIGSAQPAGNFAWPFDARTIAEGGTVNSEWQEYEGVPAVHNGMDFEVSNGTPIPAMGSGTIDTALSTADSGGRGNYIRINHGTVNSHTIMTAYSHMQSLGSWSVGDSITIGDTVGLIGLTGDTTGYHLHLEAWDNGVRVNPRDWMTNYA